MRCRAAGRALVLEATARVGGRIYTRHPKGAPAPVELGAEFIHGRPEATLDLVRRHGLRTLDLPGEYLQKVGRRLGSRQVADEGDEGATSENAGRFGYNVERQLRTLKKMTPAGIEPAPRP